jgi:hypothetical protein
MFCSSLFFFFASFFFCPFFSSLFPICFSLPSFAFLFSFLLSSFFSPLSLLFLYSFPLFFSCFSFLLSFTLLNRSCAMGLHTSAPVINGQFFLPFSFTFFFFHFSFTRYGLGNIHHIHNGATYVTTHPRPG